MDEFQLLEKRFRELAELSYTRSRFGFSDFLTLAQQDLFCRLQRELSFASPTLFGGAEGCERKMARFGDPESLGYEESFPIVCLKAEPKDKKFAQPLSHRDLLGALMNLGIKREVLGDIVVQDTAAFLFCHEKIADFVLENLKKARHTDLLLSRREAPATAELFQTEELLLQCASSRVDLVVSKVFSLSRSESLELSEHGKIFLDGKACTDPSRPCEEGMLISVRGHGKFRYCGIRSLSRKGKQNILVELYR